MLKKTAAIAAAIATTVGFGLSASATVLATPTIMGTLPTAQTIDIGDAHIANIIFDADDVGTGANSVAFELTALDDLLVIETNDVNPDDGLVGAYVEFYVDSGMGFNLVESIGGDDLLNNVLSEIALNAGDIVRIVAGWDDVVTQATQFTLRVEGNPVPVPAAGLLMLAGVAGLTSVRNRKKRNA